MSLKIAINGFGRIGRCVARILAERNDVQLVAVNDTAPRETTQYLLKYDSVHRVFNQKVEILDDDYMMMGKNKVKMFSTRDANELDFAKYGVDVVLECTGAYLTTDLCKVFLKNGIKKIIMSAPAKDDTPTFVLGVNEEKYNGQSIISNASCTTNCLGPVAKVLDDAFGIKKGLMTTIHAYTNGQNLVDVKHKKNDFRRTRAAAVNIIPTTTGAAKAISLVLPSLKGKLHGQSVRVPVPNVSMVDLNFLVGKNTRIEEINSIFKEKSLNSLKGILGYDEDFRVSQDFQTCPNSAFLASDLTQVIDNDMVKVMAWYDNEWGYSARLIDMALFVSKA